MRIAATDYDGTLCRNERVDPGTIRMIERWRMAGNRFGIVTGRDRDMLLYEIRRWRIPFDFLVCCNGAMLYDANLEVLERMDLDDAVVPAILTHPSGRASLHYELCRQGETFLHVLDSGSWFPELGPPYTELNYTESLRLTGLQQIGFAYKDPAEAPRRASALNGAFAGRACAYYNGACIDVTPPGVSKASGLQSLLDRYGWRADELLVIGDGGNDLPMIRRFSGFTVTGASEELHKAAAAVYTDVGAMLAAHLRGG